MKKRIHLWLVLLILVASVSIWSASASDAASAVYANGAPASSVVLPQDETVCLEAEMGASSYQWQIQVANIWVNILHETTPQLNLSYGMVANALTAYDTALVRCVADGTASNPVEVMLEYTFGLAETEPVMMFASRGRSVEEAEVSKEAGNGEDPAVLEGEEGAAPAPAAEEPVTVTVQHYQQNIVNDDFTLVKTDTFQLPAGSTLGGDLYQSYQGFYALPYDVNMVVEEDTTVEIRYNRYYYLMLFELSGGYGVEPIYGRYGASVEIDTPTRIGYTFDSWDPAVPATIPEPAVGYSVTYTAKWINPKAANYTIVYWGENPDDDKYSVLGTVVKSATAGTKVSGSNNIPTTVLSATEKKYFTYNAELTEQNVEVLGDGTTMVDVYYDRNVYTVHFVGNNSGELKMRTKCTLNHTHSTKCEEWHTYNVVYTIQAKYGADISALWPTSQHLTAVKDQIHPDDQGNISQLRGWAFLDNAYETKVLNGTALDKEMVFSDPYRENGTVWASMQTEMNSNLCDTENNNTKCAIAMLGKNLTTYTLHYMFESFDQSSPENAPFRKKNGTLYYDREIVETVSVTGNWSTQKAIPGMTAKGFAKSGTDIFLYYTRNTENFSVYSGDDYVLQPTKTKVGQPLKDIKIGNKTLGSYKPAYPEAYEAGTREFLGWCTNLEDPAKTMVKLDSLVMPSETFTLFAYWARIERTVTIYRDEQAMVKGEVLSGPHIVGHGTKLEPAPEKPTDEDLTFIGWFYRKDGVECAFDFENMAVVRDMDIYGKWGAFTLAEYTIRYMSDDGVTEVAEADGGYLLPGSYIEFEAKPLKELYLDYDQVFSLPKQMQSSMLINVESETNVYSFVYPEAVCAITYEMVGSDAAGSLNRSAEKVKVISGTAEGAWPAVNDGYRFLGWYLDEACTQPVPKAWVNGEILKPQKSRTYGTSLQGYDKDGVTYYAKFEESTVDLTVSVALTGADENFIFVVERVNNDGQAPVRVTIAMENGGSVTICDLPVGTYTITETSGWTWRYAGNASHTMILSSDSQYTFTAAKFAAKNDLWLSDYSLRKQ